uniref:hypothetical protein n=1 Tax=Rhizobium lupini TaxID=136996 RepID=UPI003F653649
MNFQVTVLKILVSYPDGFAVMEDLKRDMAILATSGREWADRTKRLAARVGAAAEIVPNCPLRLPSPKRTALTLLAARPIRPKNGFASGIGTGTCARVHLPSRQSREWQGRKRNRTVNDRPAGPHHAQHPGFEWKAPFCRREPQPRRAWRHRGGRRRPETG